MTACALVSRFVRTTWRCCTQPGVLSVCADVIVQSARPVVAAATRRTSAALSFRTVLGDQYLKARIVSQWVPCRTKFKKRHGHTARPAQQTIQNLDCPAAFTHDAVNFGHAGCDFRPAKGVFALWQPCGGALRLSQRGILLSEIGEHFRALKTHLCRSWPVVQLRSHD